MVFHSVTNCKDGISLRVSEELPQAVADVIDETLPQAGPAAGSAAKPARTLLRAALANPSIQPPESPRSVTSRPGDAA